MPSDPKLYEPLEAGIRTPTDAERIARLLFGENSNISEAEAMQIADTVLNRMNDQRWPATLPEVLYQDNQYSPYNPDDPNFERIMAFNETHPLWEKYLSYAEKALAPERKRSRSTHYFTGKRPGWASSMSGLTRIGSHWFGREKRKRGRSKS